MAGARVAADPLQLAHVVQRFGIQRPHGIQAQELEPDVAEVDPVEGEVPDARGAESAPVTHAFLQDASRVFELIAVVGKMLWLV